LPTFNLEDQREIPKFRQLRKRADTANAVTQPEVARILNVSEDSIQRAQKVLKLGVPELIEKVERGEIEVKPAAKIAEVKPRFIEFDGCVPLINFIVSLNLHRRHLSEGQRGVVAAKIETMRQGRQNKDANLHVSRAEAAELSADLREADKGEASEKAAAVVNVSPRTVERASKVIKTGIPELVSAVDSGAIAVSKASRIAALPPEEQKEVVARGEAGIKLGEFLRKQKEEHGLNPGGRPTEKTGTAEVQVSIPTLAAVGISRNLSSEAQMLAALPEREKIKVKTGANLR
jgi:hypothetical protein